MFNTSLNTVLFAIKKIAAKAYIMPAALLFVMLSGCATVAVKNPVDPWESWNRGVFSFNDSLDTSVVKPIATAYTTVVPNFVRTGVNNFFSNLTGAWTVVNSTLQLKPKTAVDSFFRFTINTFLGFGGVLDIASEMNIERHTADFGQTLGHYGVPPGPYLVLPFLGSSTVRDTLASTLMSRGDLLLQLNSAAVRNSLYALRLLDVRANILRSTAVLEAVALDKYTFTRDIYLQVRRNDILDGKEPPEDPTEVPEFKENAPSEQKPKLETEKKSALEPEVLLEALSGPLPEALIEVVSELLPEQPLEIKSVTQPEPKPETTPVAVSTVVSDTN